MTSVNVLSYWLIYWPQSLASVTGLSYWPHLLVIGLSYWPQSSYRPQSVFFVSVQQLAQSSYWPHYLRQLLASFTFLNYWPHLLASITGFIYWPHLLPSIQLLALAPVGLCQQQVEVLQGAEDGVDGEVVGDVVAEVCHRGNGGALQCTRLAH